MGSRTLKRWLALPLTSLEQIQKRHQVVAYLIENSEVREKVREQLQRVNDLAPSLQGCYYQDNPSRGYLPEELPKGYPPYTGACALFPLCCLDLLGSANTPFGYSL